MWTSPRGRIVILMLLTMGGVTMAAILIINEIERDEALRVVEREEASTAETVQQFVSGKPRTAAVSNRRLMSWRTTALSNGLKFSTTGPASSRIRIAPGSIRSRPTCTANSLSGSLPAVNRSLKRTPNSNDSTCSFP